MSKYTTNSPEETARLGNALAAHLQPGDVVAFTGGLGAGKTTFCRGLAKGLGCGDKVSSPTYAIVNLYRGPRPLAHFDLYRVQTEQDLEAAGFYEYLDAGAILAVEWSERLPLPAPPAVTVDMQYGEGDQRHITIEGVKNL